MAAEPLRPLMPKATAVWLVDNTSLTFEQIADFCGLHPLEVKGIADEDVAKGIKGQDPVSAGQLTREQIEEAERNPKLRLKMAPPKHKMPAIKQKKAPRYTPVSKRQDKPDAVYWILRNHPEFSDADIIKLIGTTKSTIQKIRERSHWNAPNIKAVDPVTLGLCSQLELDLAVTRANQRRERAAKRAARTGATLKPVQDQSAGAQAQRPEDEDGAEIPPLSETPAPVVIDDSSDEPADESSEP
ncbi:MAG TPA: cell cycle transcriptional regulator TrcR [Rhizomicrobium sp.]|nr:cell cycle transcriptional regulator TrcR [Rhizomicrobium sp.]